MKTKQREQVEAADNLFDIYKKFSMRKPSTMDFSELDGGEKRMQGTIASTKSNFELFKKEEVGQFAKSH